jgi:hypothetical protein
MTESLVRQEEVPPTMLEDMLHAPRVDQLGYLLILLVSCAALFVSIRATTEAAFACSYRFVTVPLTIGVSCSTIRLYWILPTYFGHTITPEGAERLVAGVCSAALPALAGSAASLGLGVCLFAIHLVWSLRQPQSRTIESR